MRAGPISESSGELSWRSHPARRNPRRTAVAIVAIVVVSIACALVGRSILWGGFAGLVLVFSLDTYFFPCRYFLRDDRIAVKRPFSSSTREWSTFRRVYRDPRGLTLSPYDRRTMLEPYRALRILFDGGDAGRIESHIRSAIGPSIEWVEVPPR